MSKCLVRLAWACLAWALCPLDAAPVRYKDGSSTDAVITCAGPAYDIGGGGGDVLAAIQWVIDQVRGTTGTGGPKLDVVVLRCSGSNGYNAPILAMNGVNSVESIVGTSAADFNDATVADAVSKAEVIFFAGGNQANYIQFIKGTATDTALKGVLARGGGLGGTSAGAAIQGAIIHDATTGSSTSAESLNDPYAAKIHFTQGWFGAAYLNDTLCEPHLQSGGNGYDRMGRLLAFVARQIQDGKSTDMLGIGIDSETSLVVDKQGMATVMGDRNVYLVRLDRLPEICKAGTPLTCSGYKIWMLTPGQRFDLAKRPGACGYYAANVTAGVLGGNYYTPGPLVNCVPPTLTTLAPTGGSVGTQVTLSGANLDGVTAVTFSGQASATVLSNSATQVMVKVPAGAVSGSIRVTTAGGSVDSASFTVQPLAKSLDLNASGAVDVLDLLDLAKAYPSRNGEVAFRAVADLNGDDLIDDKDLSIWLAGF